MEALRAAFPVLQHQGRNWHYLDNAASTQKPECVIETMNQVYREAYSNVHRGVHRLSYQLSVRFEAARETVAQFVNAVRREEIVFTKGSTEALNLLAHGLGQGLKRGDVILISHLEHHANIVPWQQICEKTGASLRVIPVDEAGNLDWHEALLDGVKILSITWVSNALGTVNDVHTLIAAARKRGIVSIVDAAQAVAHLPVDVQALACDFLVFSGHKIYGPTGVGVLYGRYAALEALPPYQTGGNMILSVAFEGSTFAPPPMKFEAGTPPIAEVLGLAEALRWFQSLDLKAIFKEEALLFQSLQSRLACLPGLRLIGQAAQHIAVQSFVLEGIHAHDVGSFLDQYGVAVRVGHHCAEPSMKRFGVAATVRASLALYNDAQDVEALVHAIEQTQRFFA